MMKKLGSKIPDELYENNSNKIGNLRECDGVVYTVSWAVISSNKNGLIRNDYIWRKNSVGTFELKIKRDGEYILVDKNSFGSNRIDVENDPICYVASLSPVIFVEDIE